MICKTHTRSDIILCSVLFINILQYSTIFSTVSLHIELAKHFTFLVTVCQLKENVIYIRLYYTRMLSQICIDLFLVLNKSDSFF